MLYFNTKEQIYNVREIYDYIYFLTIIIEILDLLIKFKKF